MTNEIKLPRHLAAAVCHMESICDIEGVGPEHTVTLELMNWIGHTYPDLKFEYNWLWCFNEDRKNG